MKKPKDIKIGKRKIGLKHPAYIIAEVGSNFDGSLKRAKKLALLAKQAGADAYKIQNFLASKIVSDSGFKNLKVSFQSNWKKSVVDVYKNAEFPREWLKELQDYCNEIDIDFLSSPYDYEAVDLLEDLGVDVHKIGSGEIDNYEFLAYVAKTKKPIIIGCGSATMKEIDGAIKAIRKVGNNKIILLQCVTNYPSPVADANLKTLEVFKDKFNVLVGYSDHTTGFDSNGDDPLDGITVPVSAVALGAKVIEKHFTDDKKREGPDHPFAMEVKDFKKMVDAIRTVEKALGDGKKRVMPSEKETVSIQRRGIYASKDILKDQKITKDDIEYLRPALSLRPYDSKKIIGKKSKVKIKKGDPIHLKYVR